MGTPLSSKLDSTLVYRDGKYGVADPGVELSSTDPTDIGTTGAVGTATTAAHADHTHAHGAQTSGTLHAAATSSKSGFLTAADKSKLDGIASGADATTATLAAANSVLTIGGARIAGVGTPVAPSDAATKSYVDSAGTTLSSTAPAALGTADAGSSAQAAHGDHVHAHGAQAGGTLHAAVTGSTNGFMSAADKNKLDGIATGADVSAPLAVTAPAAVGTTAAVGVSTSAAHGDHVHSHGAQTDGAMHAVVTGATAGFMSASDKSKLDGISSGATAVSLSATTPAVIATTGAVGTGTTAARSDHVHSIPFGTASGTVAQGNDARFGVAGSLTTASGAVAIGTATAPTAGQSLVATSPTAATWQTPAAPVALASSTPAAVGTTGTVGVGTTSARADHVHAHGTQTDGTMHAAVIASGTSGFMTGADKSKLDGIATGADVTLTALAGASASIAVNSQRITTLANPSAAQDAATKQYVDAAALSLSSTTPASIGTAAVGTGTTAARSDHVHAITYGTASGTAAQGNDARFGVAASLTTASGAVAIGTATAPSAGQTLIATSSTAATWQTPAAGVSLSSTTPAAVSNNAGGSVGTGTTAARSDHVHAHGAQLSDSTMHAAVNPSFAGFVDRNDFYALISRRQAVKCATTANVTLAGGAPNVVDGYSLSGGDRILVKNQSTATQNGIYSVTTLGTGSNGTWARTADATNSGQMSGGTSVRVLFGTSNGSTEWAITSPVGNTIIPGTDAITWSLMSSASGVAGSLATGTAATVDLTVYDGPTGPGQVLTSVDSTTGAWLTPLNMMVLTSTQPMTATGLTNIPGFSWALSAAGTYAFEFELGITQVTNSSSVGLSLAFTGSSTGFFQSVTLVKANGSVAGFSTEGCATTIGSAVVDAAARSVGGPYPARVRGTITTSTSGTCTLKAQTSAVTTNIVAGSFGRVWPVTSNGGLGT